MLTIDSAADHSPIVAFIFDGEIDETRFCTSDEVSELLTPRLARRVRSTMAARDEGWPLPRFLRSGA